MGRKFLIVFLNRPTKILQPIEEDSDKALANKAKESGEPLGDLKKVYKKG